MNNESALDYYAALEAQETNEHADEVYFLSNSRLDFLEDRIEDLRNAVNEPLYADETEYIAERFATATLLFDNIIRTATALQTEMNSKARFYIG